MNLPRNSNLILKYFPCLFWFLFCCFYFFHFLFIAAPIHLRLNPLTSHILFWLWFLIIGCVVILVIPLLSHHHHDRSTHTLHLPPDLPVLMLPASSPRKSPVPHILYMNGPIWNSQGTHQHRAAGTIHFGRWRVTEHGRVQTASLTIAPRITVSGADHGAYYEGKLESLAPQSVRAV